MKRFILLLIMALMIFTFSAVPVTAAVFSDVPEGIWYEDAVNYTLDNGLMKGTSDRTFSPEEELTRAMVVTVLYRMADSPAVNNETHFTDIPNDAWYKNAVIWAAEQNIANGITYTQFGPDIAITREEIVTLFYRYALWDDLPNDNRADLKTYEDCGEISGYAANAFRWSVGIHLINGITETTLAPKNFATRAQFAVLLQRFGSWTEEQRPDPSKVSDEIYFSEYFEPVLRFIVASDIHIHDSGSDAREQRLANMFASAYQYARTQKYTTVDGAFFAGDFTDRGTTVSMEKFFNIMNANTKPETTTGVVMGNHEYFSEEPNPQERFLKVSGYESTNNHLTVNGFHFLLLSPNDGGHNFSKEDQDWLAAELATAAAEDPTGKRPIFVFHHQHVYNTVYGSLDWGVKELTPILEQYPQVVDFSGHSHFPITDPRSIWQGSFTALGTGTLNYFEMGLAGYQESFILVSDREGGMGSPIYDAAQYYIVEVDANNAIRIQGYDMDVYSLLENPVLLRSVGDPETFVYTNHRAEESEAPVFPATTKVTLEQQDFTSVKIRFTQANCKDIVQHYRLELYEGDKHISTTRRLSCTFYRPIPETITAYFDDLKPHTDYRVEIYAVSSWAKESKPWNYTFRTASPF